jgi:predicted RNase H-like HicB family nuclease
MRRSLGKYFSLLIKSRKMLMLNVMRQIIIYPGEDGYWVAQCPSLPPCISQGKTKQEAIANIKEAIELYLEMLQEEERIIPEDQVETLRIAV